jgi:hypothetical protein
LCPLPTTLVPALTLVADSVICYTSLACSVHIPKVPCQIRGICPMLCRYAGGQEGFAWVNAWSGHEGKGLALPILDRIVAWSQHRSLANSALCTVRLYILITLFLRDVLSVIFSGVHEIRCLAVLLYGCRFGSSSRCLGRGVGCGVAVVSFRSGMPGHRRRALVDNSMLVA